MAGRVDPATTPALRWRAWLTAQWFRRDAGLTTTVLRPLSWVYAALLVLSQRSRRRASLQRVQPGRPVIVVGNLVLGGAGKTPTTIAIVQALRAAGYRPGVVSRGYGRGSHGHAAVTTRSNAAQVGDEPLLIHRRTAAPVHVGRDRVGAALQLLAQHPEVDVIVADDGLQHRQLRRDVEVIVFDERGIGNGLLLPAGPLRERFKRAPAAHALVLYNHTLPTTPWPGHCTLRGLTGIWPLASWLAGHTEAGQPLSTLTGRTVLAMAGIAVPQRFFAALENEGLLFDRLSLPDHHPYLTPPWPAGTQDVVTTEKDAVKLAAWAAGTAPEPRIWVVGLDLVLPAAFVAALLSRLPRANAP